MKPTATCLFAALLLLCGGSAFPAAPGEAPPVIAQDLTALRAAPNVSAALWTRRPDSYTLQLVMAAPGFSPLGARTLRLVDGRRMVSTSAPDAVAQPQPVAQLPRAPQTNVWLLRADGTQIIPRTPLVSSCSGRCIAVDVQYRFSIAEATQAVAAAVRIGDEFFIEKLQSLEQPQE
jgi:hypothetical protein